MIYKKCKDCDQSYAGGTKDQIRIKRCQSCYRTHERERRRITRTKKGKKHRVCPECNTKHQSPGYCRELCSTCFREHETIRKRSWRIANPEIDRARLKRWNAKNKTKVIRAQNKWRKKRLKKIKLAIVKERGGGCSKCGYSKNLAALVFHHPDPSTKEFKISAIPWHAEAIMSKELAKCVLLCANCHAEEHNPSHSIP